MAEKKDEKKKDSKKHVSHKGGLSFGVEVLLFVIAVFILWILTGGTKKPVEDKPFITPYTDTINGGDAYKPN
jgi:hypothetical protein